MVKKKRRSRVFDPYKSDGHRGKMGFENLIDCDQNFFNQLFSGEEVVDGPISYINIPGRVFGDGGEQKVLIIRDAYRRLLPYVQACWGKTTITFVTGTPGIGKTYLGAWHVQQLIWDAFENEEDGIGNSSIVAYQKKERLFVFTWDQKEKEHLGLQQQVLSLNGGKDVLWCGVSSPLNTGDMVYKLLRDSKCYMIADPQDGDKSLVENQASKGNLVVYASHGHPIIKAFASKHPILVDSNTFVLPGWPEQEIRNHLALLQLSGGGKIPEAELQERILIAGKMIRFVVTPNVDAVKKVMDSRIDEVVRSRAWNHMEDVFSTLFKGSLVSLDICGYECNISTAGQPDKVGRNEALETGSSVQEVAANKDEAIENVQDDDTRQGVAATAANPFSHDKAELVHASDYVIQQLEVKLRAFTAEEIGTMAESWSTNGYMSVFGALFERNSHIELQSGLSLPLYALQPPKGKSQSIGTLEVPAASRITLLHGSDPSKLASLNLIKGEHVRPVNSNFPTYDLYMVAGVSSLNFEGQDADKASSEQNSKSRKKKRSGDKDDDKTPWKKMKYDNQNDLLALALQCTVSGASGVPPRPKHKMYHRIVANSKSVLQQAKPQIRELCTVFVVPPVCAEEFVYQIPQTTKGENVKANMPKVQFVASLKTRYSEGFEKMLRDKKAADEKQQKEAAITRIAVASVT